MRYDLKQLGHMAIYLSAQVIEHIKFSSFSLSRLSFPSHALIRPPPPSKEIGVKKEIYRLKTS
jgi:hypothetical protein